MPAIKLTKTEQKKQKDSLKRYRRYLPTLILKKQQLQLVIRQIEGQLAMKMDQHQALFHTLQTWVGLFAENFPLDQWLRIEKVHTDYANVAGVEIPVLKSIDFTRMKYDLFFTPPWVDQAISFLSALSTLDIETGLLHRQVLLLEAELRVTSQRVNLFEKVKIPEAIENIRKIQIFLGDQQTAAVVRGKTAKKNLLKRVDAA